MSSLDLFVKMFSIKITEIKFSKFQIHKVSESSSASLALHCLGKTALIYFWVEITSVDTEKTLSENNTSLGPII